MVMIINQLLFKLDLNTRLATISDMYHKVKLILPYTLLLILLLYNKLQLLLFHYQWLKCMHANTVAINDKSLYTYVAPNLARNTENIKCSARH